MSIQRIDVRLMSSWHLGTVGCCRCRCGKSAVAAERASGRARRATWSTHSHRRRSFRAVGLAVSFTAFASPTSSQSTAGPHGDRFARSSSAAVLAEESEGNLPLAAHCFGAARPGAEGPHSRRLRSGAGLFRAGPLSRLLPPGPPREGRQLAGPRWPCHAGWTRVSPRPLHLLQQSQPRAGIAHGRRAAADLVARHMDCCAARRRPEGCAARSYPAGTRTSFARLIPATPADRRPRSWRTVTPIAAAAALGRATVANFR